MEMRTASAPKTKNNGISDFTFSILDDRSSPGACCIPTRQDAVMDTANKKTMRQAHLVLGTLTRLIDNRQKPDARLNRAICTHTINLYPMLS